MSIHSRVADLRGQEPGRGRVSHRCRNPREVHPRQCKERHAIQMEGAVLRERLRHEQRRLP